MIRPEPMKSFLSRILAHPRIAEAIPFWGRLLGRRNARRQLVNAQERSDLFSLSPPPLRFCEPDASNEANARICRRLIAAYRCAVGRAGASAVGDGVWEGHADAFHRSLQHALLAGDVEATSAILRRLFTDPVANGLALGSYVREWSRRDPYMTRLDWHDKMLSLGLALGLIPAQSPEQGTYGTTLNLDSVAVVARVEEMMGVDLAPPQVGAIFGVDIRGNAWPVNYLLHIYTANRIRSLLSLHGDDWDCVEIGGGVGFLAYAALSLGARRFCIVDLPIVNALQGYYLLCSRFADRVRLYGEPPARARDSVDIYPSNAKDELVSGSFSIAVNQDSMPEMAQETARGYVNLTHRVARRFFLSINQEARAAANRGSVQNWIHEMCKEERGLSLVYRVPYWLRKGYVEEVYRISAASSETASRSLTK
jgi:hypothetical protein